MKVEINNKTYCVETLIADNERLRKDVIASAETTRVVLDSVRAEIEQNAYPIVHGVNNHEKGMTLYGILQILDKYKSEEPRKDGKQI